MPSNSPTDVSGIAGLTDEHRGRWQARQCTYQDIGNELGVTRQTIAAAFKRRGWNVRQASRPATNLEKSETARPDQNSSAREVMGSDREAEIWARFPERAWKSLAQIYAQVLGEAAIELESGKGKLGSTSLSGIARATRAAHEGLIQLGILPSGDFAEPERPTVLEIRCLTPEEEGQIRAEAEAQAFLLDGSSPGNSEVHSDIELAVDEGRGDTSPKSTLQNQSLLHELHSAPSDPDQYEAWLFAIADRFGNSCLRPLAVALGHAGTGDKQALITAIVRLTDGKSSKLIEHLPPAP